MAIVDLREFPIPVRVEYLCKAINGEIKYQTNMSEKSTVIPSWIAKSRRSSGLEYATFGATTERLVFERDEPLCP